MLVADSTLSIVSTLLPADQISDDYVPQIIGNSDPVCSISLFFTMQSNSGRKDEK